MVGTRKIYNNQINKKIFHLKVFMLNNLILILGGIE